MDTDPYRIKNEFSDVSRVEKYEMEDDEYGKRNGLSLSSIPLKHSRLNCRHGALLFAAQ